MAEDSLRIPKTVKLLKDVHIGEFYFAYANERVTVIGQYETGLRVQNSKGLAFTIMHNEYHQPEYR